MPQKSDNDRINRIVYNEWKSDDKQILMKKQISIEEYICKQRNKERMKIEWKKINLEDKMLLEPYYQYEQSSSCEVSFANNLLWAPFYEVEYAIVEEMLVFQSKKDGYSVSMPMAKDEMAAANLEKVILQLEDYFNQIGQQFHMHLVTREKFELLETLFPGKYEIEFDRDAADYIYEVEKMISLAGKKLHGKRNHINKFKENNPDWSYEPLTMENLEECLKMAEEWKGINLCGEKGGKHVEFCVARRALTQFRELGLKGGILRDGRRIVAFTLGEELNRDMFVVHIEKAFADVQGAYPMINKQFLIHEASKYRYVNREDDTGAEGLRKAKLSYYPVFLQEKGNVTIKK